jgi:pimeloyl-ACP methyl ester carboxylesterase
MAKGAAGVPWLARGPGCLGTGGRADSGKGDAGGFMGRWYHFDRDVVKPETRGNSMPRPTTPALNDALSIPLRTGARVGVHDCGRAGSQLPLVLVPGVGGAKELFHSLMEPLARNRRVVAVDLSPRVPSRTSVVDSGVEDLLEVLAALEIERCDLLGQSFGAVVATRASRAQSGKIRRLVLASPATPPRGWAAPRMVLLGLVTGGAIRVWPRSKDHSLRRWIRSVGGYALEPALDGEDFDALVRRVRRLPVTPFFRRLAACARHSWVRELEGVTAPLLILEGDREAALLPPAILSFFGSRPRTRLVIVPGGHMPFLTDPARFSEAVTTFLSVPEDSDQA